MRILGSTLNRGEVWRMGLDPVQGSEQSGARPCVIISPDSMNAALDTLVVIPLSTKKKNWPSRVDIHFAGKDGQALCEQLRVVSKQRLATHLGSLAMQELAQIRIVLRYMFFD